MRRTESGAFWEFRDGGQVILPPHDDLAACLALVAAEAPERWALDCPARWTDEDGAVHVPLLVRVQQ